MKAKFVALFSLLSIIYTLHSQDYQISFSGTGTTTDVDSVKVENLTQCATLDMSGSDILHLVAEVGIDEIDTQASLVLQVYPNPVTSFCFVDFEIFKSGHVIIGLYDIAGKRISQIQELLSEGHHTYQLSGIKSGIFILRVESEDQIYTSKIVSNNTTSQNAEIKHIETIPSTIFSDNIAKSSKEEKSLTDMQYTVGDLLKLTGKSGINRTVVMLVPAGNQTVNFNFIGCTDDDGNSYAIVEIGPQWWMAENLNAGTYVPVTTPQVSGTKFCMDVNGQADPSCPMGGLYEWVNLMQGSSQCNGTGAPPNDRCANPVKGLCPNGWHIPSHYEWTTLERNAGSNPGAFPYDMSTISLLGTDEGGNLKETCTTYWWAPNAGATNLSGFSGLPGGDTWNGVFEDFGQSAYFWTSTEPLFFAWVHALNYSLSVIGRSSYAIESGFSVRCVID